MQLNGQSPWRLRWVFDYSDGKTSKRGVWDWHSNTDLAGCAFLQNKNNLLYAAIEAQDRDKTQIIRPVECAGPDFCTFQWIAMSMVSLNSFKEQSIEGKIIGIKLVAREQEVTVYCNGTIETKAREYSDNLFHYGKLDNA
jgi:hypothetical protein